MSIGYAIGQTESTQLSARADPKIAVDLDQVCLDGHSGHEQGRGGMGCRSSQLSISVQRSECLARARASVTSPAIGTTLKLLIPQREGTVVGVWRSRTTWTHLAIVRGGLSKDLGGPHRAAPTGTSRSCSHALRCSLCASWIRDAAVTDCRHGLTHGQTGVQAVTSRKIPAARSHKEESGRRTGVGRLARRHPDAG